MDLRQQQIQHEASLNHSLIGKEFYVLCPDNPKYFRSVFIKRNIFTGMPQTMVSPCVYAVPPVIRDLPNIVAPSPVNAFVPPATIPSVADSTAPLVNALVY